MSVARIRELNDSFRSTFTGGKVVLTAGVAARADDVRRDVIARVRAFAAFTPENDPHQEHDFGSFEVHGLKVFWKLDFYDAEMQFGSEDPADPTRTTRVLTIMLAEEY